MDQANDGVDDPTRKRSTSELIFKFLYSSVMTSGKSLALATLLAFFAGVAIASSPGTNTVEHTFCVNSKTKVVTYARSGKCPKGNEAIQVGAIGPQGPQGMQGEVGPSGLIGLVGPQGEPARTSFNLLLRDGNGKLVEDLVADGAVYKDGRYWSLNYETGKFFPINGYLYVSFTDPACKANPVVVLNSVSQSSAERELERLKTESKSSPFVLHDGIQRIGEDFYSVSSEVKVVDNRDAAIGPAWDQWTLKQEIYSLNHLLDVCDKNPLAFFYLDSISKVEVKIPDPLPTPIRWSRT